MIIQRQIASPATLRRSACTLPLRLLSTSTQTPSSTPTTTKTPEAYVSTSQDPWFNLSLEHFLFTSRDSETPVCFLYRNRPCVVIGRNQNPWKELNAISMRKKEIPFVRRRSGGGTVYHDLGNTNYSFHTSRNAFKRETHSNLIVKALNGLLFPFQSKDSDFEVDLNSIKVGDPHPSGTYVNSRNDICIKVKLPSNDSSSPFQELKISGSAYKLISSRAYHHGTMLLNASLNSLGKVLHNDRIGLTSKGVESFRSPVINLGQFFEKDRINHDRFTEIVVKEFQQTYGEGQVMEIGEEILEEANENLVFDVKGVEDFRKGYQELKSWEWNFGGSPEFFHVLNSRRQSRESSTNSEASFSSSSSSPANPKTFHSSDLIEKEFKETTTSIDNSNLLQTQSFPLTWGEFSLKVKSRNGLIENIELIPKISIDNEENPSTTSIETKTSLQTSEMDLDSSHEASLISILKHFEGKRYDDFGFSSLSGVDFERDSEEVEGEIQKRRNQFRKEVLSSGEGDEKLREEILDDILKWFEVAL